MSPDRNAIAHPHSSTYYKAAQQANQQSHAQQQNLAAAHDDFFKQLERSADGFGTVSEYLGRGMLCTLSKGAAGR